MQVCNVILPTPVTLVIFSCIFAFFGVIMPNSQLPKCTKTCIKLHIKRPKIVCSWGFAADPIGVGRFFIERHGGHGRVMGSAGGLPAKKG